MPRKFYAFFLPRSPLFYALNDKKNLHFFVITRFLLIFANKFGTKKSFYQSYKLEKK